MPRKYRCSRANETRPEWANTHLLFCWGATRLALRLCGPHNTALHTDMTIWARHGRRVGGHDAFRYDYPLTLDAVADCDRCILPTPATAQLRFCLDRQRHQLRLCEQHSESFDLDFLPWIRIAEVVDGGHEPPPTPTRPQARGDAATADITRLLKLIRQDQHVELPAEQPRAAAAPTLAPAAPFDWIITHHAGLRALQRGVGYDELVAAVTAPQLVTPSTSVAGVEVHHRDGIKVVVNPAERRVITVCRPDEDDEEALRTTTPTTQRETA